MTDDEMTDDEIIAALDDDARVLLLAFYHSQSPTLRQWSDALGGAEDPSWRVLVSLDLVTTDWRPKRNPRGREITRKLVGPTIEAGVVVTHAGPVHWHLPRGRSSVELPDSRSLWEVLWEHREAPRLGFAHSHPGSGCPVPSHTDLTTFVAVESGLGRRLDWWITSSDTTVLLTWIDPTLRYSTLVVPSPEWITFLRAYSQMTPATQAQGQKP